MDVAQFAFAEVQRLRDDARVLDLQLQQLNDARMTALATLNVLVWTGGHARAFRHETEEAVGILSQESAKLESLIDSIRQLANQREREALEFQVLTTNGVQGSSPTLQAPSQPAPPPPPPLNLQGPGRTEGTIRVE